jgi:hypothetical protein
MGNETIMAVKQKLAAMKKIEAAGFGDPEKAAEYFRDKEVILEDIVKALEAAAAGQGQETEALKATVRSLRDDLKSRAASPRELSRRELCYGLGKGIAAAWAGDYRALAGLSFSPNLKADKWTNPRDVSWDEKGWNMATNDQYLINPIYETEIMQDARRKA